MLNYPKIPHEYGGKIIVLDGLGGSGKTTQTKLLQARLKKEGILAETVSLPVYNLAPYGPIIRKYVDNHFGAADQLHPIPASLPYALNRSMIRGDIIRALSMNQWIIFTRYIHSNLAYQGAKFEGYSREEFLAWLVDYEFEHLGLIREDLGILLDQPLATSLKMVEKRSSKGGEGRDGHEQSSSFVDTVNGLYRQIAHELPHWEIVNCCCKTKPSMRPPKTIADEIWRVVTEKVLIKGEKP